MTGCIVLLSVKHPEKGIYQDKLSAIISLLIIISLKIVLNYRLPIGSVHFTKNCGYQSLKNRSCITVFDSCSVTLTVGEPLGDVFDSANHDF